MALAFVHKSIRRHAKLRRYHMEMRPVCQKESRRLSLGTGQRANRLTQPSQLIGGIGAPFADGDNPVFLESFGN